MGVEVNTIKIIEKASGIGREHGIAAGTWVFDGNTSRETYEQTRKMIDDGDPEVYDSLPHANLSGEWADSYSSNDLLRDLGVNDSDPDVDRNEIFIAYETAFNDGVVEEIERAISVQLD